MSGEVGRNDMRGGKKRVFFSEIPIDLREEVKHE
jgi:hypothetical protein